MRHGIHQLYTIQLIIAIIIMKLEIVKLKIFFLQVFIFYIYFIFEMLFNVPKDKIRGKLLKHFSLFHVFEHLLSIPSFQLIFNFSSLKWNFKFGEFCDQI